jgi:hypothetical protein
LPSPSSELVGDQMVVREELGDCQVVPQLTRDQTFK